MHDPSDQLGKVRQLIQLAPDSTLANLTTALGAGVALEQPLRAIAEMVDTESLERSVRAAAFAPVSPLCAPSSGPRGLAFPTDTLALVWRALKDRSPVAVAEVVSKAMAPAAKPARLFDAVCVQSAKGLRDRASPQFHAIAARLDAAHPNGALVFAQILDLAPLARRALPRLSTWLRSAPAAENDGLRGAFSEAATATGSAALLMEILFVHLNDPYQVLRLISAVMDHPSEHYLAASEMASFGQRLMDDIDRRIDVLRRFDANRGLEAGAEIAAAVNVASHGLAEFDAHIGVRRQGPWGARLQGQRRALTMFAEARLREIPPAVDVVLPAVISRAKAGKPFGLPCAAEPPNPYLVTRAHALLAFLHGIQTGAGAGGFEALRIRLVDDLTSRLDYHVENLLEALHRASPEQRASLRAHIEVAAEFLSLVQNPQSAEFVRRRAAAA